MERREGERERERERAREVCHHLQTDRGTGNSVLMAGVNIAIQVVSWLATALMLRCT